MAESKRKELFDKNEQDFRTLSHLENLVEDIQLSSEKVDEQIEKLIGKMPQSLDKEIVWDSNREQDLSGLLSDLGEYLNVLNKHKDEIKEIYEQLK